MIRNSDALPSRRSHPPRCLTSRSSRDELDDDASRTTYYKDGVNSHASKGLHTPCPAHAQASADEHHPSQHTGRPCVRALATWSSHHRAPFQLHAQPSHTTAPASAILHPVRSVRSHLHHSRCRGSPPSCTQACLTGSTYALLRNLELKRRLKPPFFLALREPQDPRGKAHNPPAQIQVRQLRACSHTHVHVRKPAGLEALAGHLSSCCATGCGCAMLATRQLHTL